MEVNLTNNSTVFDPARVVILSAIIFIGTINIIFYLNTIVIICYHSNVFCNTFYGFVKALGICEIYMLGYYTCYCRNSIGSTNS